MWTEWSDGRDLPNTLFLPECNGYYIVHQMSGAVKVTQTAVSSDVTPIGIVENMNPI